MRTRLGGRGESEAEIGAIVRFEPAEGMALFGVVLFVEGGFAHVLLEGGTVRRTSRDSLSEVDDGDHAELALIAQDARTFGELREGDAVRYADSQGTLGEGTLVEKCRFGALVARPDGVVMGIGFRKISPEGSRPSS